MNPKCSMLVLHAGFHLGFFAWGGRLCKINIVCEAYNIFEPIFEYHAITNARKNIKPEFLSLDIVLIVKTFWGEVGGFGGEAFPPPHPPVDETLAWCCKNIVRVQSLNSLYI